MLVSILIPAFNEEDTIETVVEAVKKLDFDKEIVVVDDGSTDRTAEIASRLGGITFIRHPGNMGRGSAVMTAIKHSTGDILVTQDADMEQSPSDIPRLVRPVIEGRALVVYGSRFARGVSGTGNTAFRLFGNRVFAFLGKVLFRQNLTDVYTGSKCYSKKIFETITLTRKGFEQEIEILAKLSRNRIQIHEIPITYRFRSFGESKIRFTDAIIGIFVMFKYFIGHG